ncbi:probable G-protein coupled receptor 148 [Hemicordylus capensis]|uniref:probable G-protein coupled receptor 148 n=1 Tax=Hemicordylus capensis TaxID=884348 RepID=UPI002303D17B|nr:probable G-protein coupled receptor 148 [Hemicordylus capensis]
MNFSLCVSTRILNTTFPQYREFDFNATFSLDKPSLHSLQEWITYPPHSKTKMFLIPPIMCLTAAILITPFILFVIFSRVNIRQETRYLLLGNALLCDLIYLILYTMSAVFNVSNFTLPKSACVILLFLLAMTYCGGLLTAAAMVFDTYLAILWPLHYVSILPSSRTKQLILFLWISSGVLPGIIFLTLQITQKHDECTVETCSVPIILIMTLHGNDAVKLCYVLSVSALFLSIVIESLLYINAIIGLQEGIWVSLIICNVVMILPKALSPYLCGLRYRDISSSLKFFLRRKRVTVVSPVTST